MNLLINGLYYFVEIEKKILILPKILSYGTEEKQRH
jgi:hypothetical protein